MKKYLVIQTAFIGDVILATAVLEKLHAADGHGQIDILVRKGNEPLLAGHPFINECLVWNKKNDKYRGLMALLRKIRKRRYDAVINLQRYAASGFLTAFSGAKEKIGFDKNPFSFFFDKKIEHEIGEMNTPRTHEVERCLNTIAHIKATGTFGPRLYPRREDFERIESYIVSPFVTISPASVWFTKQTPASVWSEFIRVNPNTKFYLLGSPDDAALCQTIAGNFKNVAVLAGGLSLLQSAALMSKAKMNFTNDSAPMHLCSAMNAPVTAVFCSTVPEFGFGPLSEIAHIIQSRVMPPCKPCGIHGFRSCPKGHFNCGNIDVGDLNGAVQS